MTGVRSAYAAIVTSYVRFESCENLVLALLPSAIEALNEEADGMLRRRLLQTVKDRRLALST
jgi:hypothetical protein